MMLRDAANLFIATPILLALSACQQPPASSTAAPGGSASSSLERGKFLVEYGGCHDCHTPKKLGPNGPEPDMARMLSGHPETQAVTAPFQPTGEVWTAATNDHLTAWSGPWGVSFAPNLTPDLNTGLRSGVWTEALFIQAMRTGKHVGTSREILPPMPWQAIGKLSDDDLKAMWTFLGTIPPVLNHVPDPLPPAGAR